MKKAARKLFRKDKSKKKEVVKKKLPKIGTATPTVEPVKAEILPSPQVTTNQPVPVPQTIPTQTPETKEVSPPSQTVSTPPTTQPPLDTPAAQMEELKTSESSPIQIKEVSLSKEIPVEKPQTSKNPIEEIFPQEPPLRKGLRMKLILFALIPSLVLTLFGFLMSSITIRQPWVIFALFLLVFTPCAFLIWWFLRPLDKIYLLLQTLAKGELKQSVDLRSGDEFEDIGTLLNKMADNLNISIKQAGADKDLNTAEINKMITILSAIKDGIIVLDLHQNVVLANQAAQNLTGWFVKDMLGHQIDEILNLADKTGQALTSKEYAHFNLSAPDGDVFSDPRPLTLLDKKGGQTVVTILSSAVKASLQTDLGAVIMLRDVSHQKDLDSMQIDFVSMASHELRTPLTSIKGYLSVYLQENSKKLSKEQKEFLERISISTQQLAGLVDNLLSVAKVERGAISLSTETISLGELLDQSVHDNALQADKKNIKLTYQTAPNISVKVDKIRIMEVINNLISNAINYTQEGGKVDVSAKIDGQEVITSVKDTGRGLSPDTLANLFTKFFRVQGALDLSSNSRGTGLGLYLSKSIISLHKGKIWAESPGIGKGSTFLFSLPIAEKVSVKNKLAPLEVPHTLS